MITIRSMQTTAWAVPILCTTVLFTACAKGGEPRFEDLVLSDERDGAPVDSFAPDTPEIFLLARLVDVPSGSTVKALWIAERTEVAPPDYQIDSTELAIGALMNQATFSLSRPNAGWPAGEYRVELSINENPAATVRFSVAP